MEEKKKKRAGRNEITRERVISAAFTELKENGWENWNARRIAKRTGCSTMPLFRLFKNMDEIRNAVISECLKTYEKYIEEGRKEPLAYRGMGRAYIRFAKEEPWIFKALCASEEFTGKNFSAIDPTVSTVLAEAEKSGNVNEETAKRLHACMTIFCHGAAMMASTGAASVPESAFDSLMSDVFLALKAFYSRSSYRKEIDGGKNIKNDGAEAKSGELYGNISEND